MQVENPKAEDVECLCKLLTTIGVLLDASQKGNALMGAYFNRLEKLALSPKLESRHRFMIRVSVEVSVFVNCFDLEWFGKQSQDHM